MTGVAPFHDPECEQIMLLVMDESGDDGLNIPPGQNPWLVVGGVLFGSRKAAAECRAALLELHKRLGGKEFRFSKNTPDRRREVLTCLASFPLRYFAVACDKSRLDRGRWRKPADVYAEVSRRVIELAASELTGCTVWFDTRGGGTADQDYGKRLRQAAGKLPDGKARVMDCRGFDSKRELLIQAADYVCGVISHFVRNEEIGNEYRKIISRCEAGLRIWPEL